VRARTILVAVLAAGSLAGTGRALAQQPVPAPTVIEVTGAAIVSVVPDRASVPVTVQAREETSLSATLRNEQGMASLTTLLKETGIAATDVKVDPVRVAPKTRPAPAPQTPGTPRGVEPDGYEATTQIRIVFRDLGKIERFLSEVRAIPEAKPGMVSYSVLDPSAGAETARKAAFDAARRKAEKVAAMAGLKLGRLVRVTTPTRDPMGIAASMMRPDGLSFQVQTDDVVRITADLPKGARSTEVRATLDVAWEAR